MFLLSASQHIGQSYQKRPTTWSPWIHTQGRQKMAAHVNSHNKGTPAPKQKKSTIDVYK